MDNLKYLLSAYFHQDWNHAHDSWQAVVDEFVTDDLSTVKAVPDEIDRALTETVDDAELELLLRSLGCDYDPDEGDRAWLEAVADRIRQQLMDP
jgi:CdiI immunity protein